MKLLLLTALAASATALTFENAVVAPVNNRRRRQLQVCDDGNQADSSGCCGASSCNLQSTNAGQSACCSGCCISSSVSSSGAGTTCGCQGCGDATGTGDSAIVDAQCDGTLSGCTTYMTSQGASLVGALDFLGCTFCLGDAGSYSIACWPTTSAQSTCLSQQNALASATTISVETSSAGGARGSLPNTRLACAVGSSGGGGGDSNPCFDREVSTACRLIDQNGTPSAAFSDCFGQAQHGVAERVLMKDLTAGDRVLSSESEITRVIVNQHVNSPRTSPMLEIHHASGTLSLTPDHVLLVDGHFVPAREAKAGATLSSGAVIEAVSGTTSGIISPLTANGRILAAGPTGTPIIATVWGEWIAAFMLDRSTASIVSGISYFFPEATQAYYDALLEAFFDALTPSLKRVAVMPAPTVTLTMVLLDLAMALGFVFFSAASLKGAAALLAVVGVIKMRAKA